jgi:hypothetical protein
MENNKTNIQFHYFQDEEVPQRVLTLATQKVSQDLFKVAYSVNRVDHYESEGSYQDPNTGMTVVYVRDSVAFDPFCKSIARTITRGRLAKEHSFVVEVPENTSVRRAVLNMLSVHEDVPDVVNKISQQVIDRFNQLDNNGEQEEYHDAKLGTD